ncbi:hypothetical protein A7K93_02825 [Candidatus Methylacidiphilum fumarolicum]|nr:hypothetical protein A7K73_00320 [Candidatus Methylacidiphilum fumarolicum]TFE74864.1 hypothetical protein A7K93_02825 [Candidatus Methylacidiphilum fumarolicum]TFE75509.1 hypothetical protein A7K72_01615 [Candidatus Methylacidiphilum fumarolicum]TFE77980.1 hypothetical protein A7D33_00225 [Candidatus Methylacidiphilum fumarolicum]
MANLYSPKKFDALIGRSLSWQLQKAAAKGVAHQTDLSKPVTERLGDRSKRTKLQEEEFPYL